MEEPRRIPRFDVVSDYSDHHYANQKPPANFSSTFHKRMNYEWKSLAANLPDTITVCAYEERVDLMTAAIVGAHGTPYHDGLFFFDIMFTKSYPAHPPKVYYWSYGERINPNLYANGMVCLSLLNTWIGAASERWDSRNSTMLQVLLSIQALVLNEQPFFNEPGYHNSGSATDLKKSNSYNELVFTLSCKTMTHLMNRPPKGFESLVKDHFKDRCEAILGSCEAYIHGWALVGGYSSGSSKVLQSSMKFRSGLSVLRPKLVKGFESCGADVERFKQQFAEEEKEKEIIEKEIIEKEKKKKNGVMGRVWRKFMAFFKGKDKRITKEKA